MDLEAKTVMGQMNIVSGQWVSDVPNALAVREPVGQSGAGRRKGDLFVVVQLMGCETLPPLCRQMSRSLATTIRNTYYHSPSSIAASLRRALIAGNSMLLDAGSQSSASLGLQEDLRITAGAVVMAVRGREVFVATVGPAAAYLLNQGEPAHFPEGAYWPGEGPSNTAASSVLGHGLEVEIDIAHASVTDGDIVVIGDGRFASQTSREAIQVALSSGTVEDALAVLGKLAGERDCTALVAQILLSHEVESRDDPGLVAIPIPSTERPPMDVQLRNDYPVDGVSGSAMPITAHLQVGRVLMRAGERLGTLLVWLGKGVFTVFQAALPGQPSDGLPVPGVESQQKPARDSRRIPQRLLRAIALVLPVLVLLLVLSVYWRQIADRQDVYDASLVQAAAFYEQAVDTEDAVAARALLEQADGLLAAAAEVNRDDPVIYDLRSSVEIARDRVNRVERLYWIGRVYGYEGNRVRLRRVVVDGMDVYVLDAGNNVVYHHQLDEAMDGLRSGGTDPLLVQRAEQVGTSVVGEMIDMAWVRAAGARQASSLVMLEGDGLLEYNPRMGLDAMDVDGAGQWLGPVAAAGYGGNYYILDSPAGQIFRYLPTGGGYSNLPELYFPDALTDELRGAIDLAIDGFVYVLYADCSLRKYERGLAAEFELVGVPTPMTNCVALFTAPDDLTHSLYIADTGGGRIVQLDKQGRFVRQLKPREENLVDFTDLKSIFVDEMSAKLFFLDSHSLYIANLPPAP